MILNVSRFLNKNLSCATPSECLPVDGGLIRVRVGHVLSLSVVDRESTDKDRAPAILVWATDKDRAPAILVWATDKYRAPAILVWANQINV